MLALRWASSPHVNTFGTQHVTDRQNETKNGDGKGKRLFPQRLTNKGIDVKSECLMIPLLNPAIYVTRSTPESDENRCNDT